MSTDLKKTDEKQPLAKAELSQSERFTQAVINQFTDTAGELKLTKFQQHLTNNYFIKLDQTLKTSEQKRNADYNNLPFTWANVNMNKLALESVAFSGVGLDPIQPNHINLIPHKNAKTEKYDIAFIVGYKGKEIKARKYGLEVPDEIVVELIYQKDNFVQIKKDKNNKIETYTFEITDNFDRGPVVGGFYYYRYFNQELKNKLKVFSLADILKRKPGTASPEFWGGQKDEWKNGKKTGNKVTIDGWAEEMYHKTLYSAGWGAITIDASKIDEHYRKVLELERQPLDAKVLLEIKENANMGETIGFEEVKTEAIEPAPLPETTANQPEETKSEEENSNGPTF